MIFLLNTYWIDSIKKPDYYDDISSQLQYNLKKIKYNTKKTCECYDWYFNIQNNAVNLNVQNSKSKKFDTVVSEWYIKDCFRQYKQVYILNNSLYHRLISTKNVGEISFEILKKLPFDSFYIDSDSCNIIENGYKVNGLFVSIDNYVYNGILCNYLVLILRINKELVPLRIDLLKNQNIEQAINSNWCTNSYFDADVLKKLFINFFQIVLYMCCDKADIVKMVQRKQHSKKGKKVQNRMSSITYSQIGFVIGKTFSDKEIKYINNNVSDDNIKGSSKAPHFRKPHWCLYHTGKNRTETVLKWIDLIFVNGNGSDKELPITLHNMR